MNLVESITKLCLANVKEFTKLATIKLNDIESVVRLKLAKQFNILEFRDRAGIYLFCKKGHAPWDSNAVVFYVGCTLKCVLMRITAHFKSFENPDSKQESTARSFAKFKVSTNQAFDIYFIDAETLGIENGMQAEAVEKMFQDIFNVVVRDTKHVK